MIQFIFNCLYEILTLNFWSNYDEELATIANNLLSFNTQVSSLVMPEVLDIDLNYQELYESIDRFRAIEILSHEQIESLKLSQINYFSEKSSKTIFKNETMLHNYFNAHIDSHYTVIHDIVADYEKLIHFDNNNNLYNIYRLIDNIDALKHNNIINEIDHYINTDADISETYSKENFFFKTNCRFLNYEWLQKPVQEIYVKNLEFMRTLLSSKNSKYK